MKILHVTGLNITDRKTSKSLVVNSSFELKEGDCLAIAGESGSGKSLTCRAIMRLNKPELKQTGSILYNGEDLNLLSSQAMRSMRGKQLCYIPQNGMTAFDPTCVVGVHLHETLAQHFSWNKSERITAITRAVESVALKQPVELMNKYPHELSGGMLQRIMIALALILEPKLIIADEPTTALDAISQYEVIEQLKALRQRLNCSMMIVSHDLGVIKKLADQVLIMKDGSIIERGPKHSIFTEAKHNYTKTLVSSKLLLADHFNQLMREDATC